MVRERVVKKNKRDKRIYGRSRKENRGQKFAKMDRKARRMNKIIIGKERGIYKTEIVKKYKERDRNSSKI